LNNVFSIEERSDDPGHLYVVLGGKPPAQNFYFISNEERGGQVISFQKE